MRVVRRPDGAIVLDPTGRQPGRGAYLCPDAACWEIAARKGALERAFRATLPDELRDIVAAGPAGLAAITIESPRAADGAPAAQPDIDFEGGTRGQE